jgi:predicted DNA-binding transcriptional regulator AlpA
VTTSSDIGSPRPKRAPPGTRPHAVQVTAAKKQTAESLPALRDLQLLTRQEIVSLIGLSYPTIWQKIREGKFPAARVVGGKNMWLATEIDHWVSSLPVRELKPLDEAAS